MHRRRRPESATSGASVPAWSAGRVGGDNGSLGPCAGVLRVCARASSTADSQCARRRRRRLTTPRPNTKHGAHGARAETAKTVARLRRANIYII